MKKNAVEILAIIAIPSGVRDKKNSNNATEQTEKCENSLDSYCVCVADCRSVCLFTYYSRHVCDEVCLLREFHWIQSMNESTFWPTNRPTDRSTHMSKQTECMHEPTNLFTYYDFFRFSACGLTRGVTQQWYSTEIKRAFDWHIDHSLTHSLRRLIKFSP